jgi:hypothetical protein
MTGEGTGPDHVERLRKLCLALPEVTERQSHGEPTWFVRDRKVFVQLSDHHHDDRLGFWCAATAEERDALVERDSGRYFRPPYVGGRGWLGVYLDGQTRGAGPPDWDEIDELVRRSYRLIAPKTLAQRLETPDSP